jgi:hypothetical protein
MSRWRLVALVLAALALAALVVAPRVTFDRAGWLADLDQLESHLATAYANLEDAPRRGLDLAALDRTTRSALEAAHTDGEARAALAAFLGAFRDPHLGIDRVKLSKRVEQAWRRLTTGDPDGPVVLRRELTADEACAAIGVSSAPRTELGYDLADLPGFVALPPGDHAAGLLEVDGRRVGLVRIPSFEARHYPAACARAWDRVRPTLSGPCEGECAERLAWTGLEDAVLAGLAARVREVAAAGATALVVDVTGNGGGSGWADAAARVVTGRTLDCPGSGFVRHPHYAGRFEGWVRDLEQEARRTDLTAVEADLVARARVRAAVLLEEARRPCDVSGLWRGERPGCTLRVAPGGRACGLLGPLPRDVVRDPRGWSLLDGLWQYTYEPGVWTGPLAVLVDGRTASASEAFAATLRDGDAARLVGERTLGAGCGYTNGGIPLRLAHGGLEVKAPDCSRLRRDGTNEIDGLDPDHPLPAPTRAGAHAALAAWLRGEVAAAR